MIQDWVINPPDMHDSNELSITQKVQRKERFFKSLENLQLTREFMTKDEYEAAVKRFRMQAKNIGIESPI